MPLSAVQPERYDELLARKSDAVSALLAPYSPPPPSIYPSSPTGFRMRAEFRMWHDGDELDYVMFNREDPRTPVPIQHFPIACERIQALMPVLRERLRNDAVLRRKLFQVEFLSTLAGDTLVTLVYHRKLDEAWCDEAGRLGEALGVSIIGRSPQTENRARAGLRGRGPANRRPGVPLSTVRTGLHPAKRPTEYRHDRVGLRAGNRAAR